MRSVRACAASKGTRTPSSISPTENSRGAPYGDENVTCKSMPAFRQRQLARLITRLPDRS